MTISRYDHSNKGELSIKEWFNVLKIQNHIDTSMDMVRNIIFFVTHHQPKDQAGKRKFLGYKCL